MERRKEVYQQALSDFVRVENDVRHLEMQILTAEQQGKDGFDSDRFLEKLRVKPSPTVNPRPASEKGGTYEV